MKVVRAINARNIYEKQIAYEYFRSAAQRMQQLLGKLRNARNEEGEKATGRKMKSMSL